MIFFKYTYFQLLCVLVTITAVLPIVLGHSINNNRVNRIEPLSNIQFEKRYAFEKRYHSTNRDPVRLSLIAYNTTFYLHLEPNFDLFHPQAVIHYQGSSRPATKDNINVYKGHVIDKQEDELYPSSRKLGWARILIRHDLMHKHDQPILEGAFQAHGDIYHIKSTRNYNLVKRFEDASVTFNESMVIYRESDTSDLMKRQNQHQCGFDSLLLNSHLTKRGITIRSVQGCPTTRKINYMGAAADCTYVRHYKTIDNARIQIINNFNMASAVFEETFNVALGLINITVMDPNCDTKIDQKRPWNRACDATYALGDRLSDFSLWRSSMSNDGAGLWHLMTNCPTGVEVGLAWLKQLCNSGKSTQMSSAGKVQYVTGAGVSAVTREEWKVVAHEIGHGFGAIHDCTSSDCPCKEGDCNCCQLDQPQCDTSGYLMSSISNSTAKHFSQCSINTICDAFPSLGTCLNDPSDHLQPVHQLNVCGNGIREPGEECDTGGEESHCCDSKTCKLKPEAVCEDKNDSCCHQCQIRPKTHMCRAAATLCDVEEYCTGDSPTCPTDSYLPDGLACGNGGLKCASGQCTSRDAQCLSRGYVMNVTQSCQKDNDGCKLLCDSPGNNEKCLLFSGSFIDGTPCGFGGQCFSGECRNSDMLSTNLQWLGRHKHITIPVGVAILLMLCICGLLLFWFGCWRCTGYREKRQKIIAPVKKNESSTLHDSSLTLTAHQLKTASSTSPLSSASSATAVNER